jgi:subtilisin family serine protease
MSDPLWPLAGRSEPLAHNAPIPALAAPLMLALTLFTAAPQAAERTQAAAATAAATVKPRPSAFSALRTGLSPSARIALKPKHPVKKPDRTEHWKGLRRDALVVKFADGARVREEASSARQRAKTDGPTLSARLDALKPQVRSLDDYDRELLKRRNLQPDQLEHQVQEARTLLKAHTLKHWRKVFDLDDDLLERLRINAEVRKGRQASDLSNYYLFTLDDAAEGERLADRLNRLEVVELAYLAPIPKPADVPPATPSFQGQQGHLRAAPAGIDALYAWTVPGGKGNLVKIVDIESGWNLNHEDLPSMFITDGRNDDDDSRQHGTAVMGVLVARDDGAGVTGIVPQASGGVVSVNRGLGIAYFGNVAEAVLVAAMSLSEGDVILIEQHARGPGSDKDCTACITSDGKPRDQCGYIAMEYWNDIFDAVNAATASGVIVVQAAGNGEMNLDNARYDDRFDRNVRNSGAILVGAGDSATRAPLCFSNNGSRLDLQGWGENVTTAGYGTPNALRANGGDDNQWYTSTFSGTSSATPIVAGAVAAIQGIQIANNNPALDWFEMTDLLGRTGTPQGSGKRIGPLPDLKAAIAELPAPSKPNAVYRTAIALEPTLLDADRTVSGFEGARTRTIASGEELGAIERLRFGERSDRPCYVRVEKADIVTNQILTPHAELDLCGNNGPTDRSLEFVPTVTPGHDTFVRGVSVCNSTTGNSTRLKGVKLYLARIDPDGSFAMVSNPSTLERPNCDDTWRTPAMCPAGSIATRLEIHIRPDGNDEVITGLSVKCKKVEVTRTCVSGC